MIFSSHETLQIRKFIDFQPKKKTRKVKKNWSDASGSSPYGELVDAGFFSVFLCTVFFFDDLFWVYASKIFYQLFLIHFLIIRHSTFKMLGDVLFFFLFICWENQRAQGREMKTAYDPKKESDKKRGQWKVFWCFCFVSSGAPSSRVSNSASKYAFCADFFGVKRYVYWARKTKTKWKKVEWAQKKIISRKASKKIWECQSIERKKGKIKVKLCWCKTFFLALWKMGGGKQRNWHWGKWKKKCKGADLSDNMIP